MPVSHIWIHSYAMKIFLQMISQYGRMKDSETNQVEIEENLSKKESLDLRKLLGEYPDLFQSIPGRTTMTEHRIKTETAQPIMLPQQESVNHPLVSGAYLLYW